MSKKFIADRLLAEKVTLMAKLQDMTAGRLDPMVVGVLQVILDLGAFQADHIELILKRINRKHIVIDHLPGADRAVVGHKRRR